MKRIVLFEIGATVLSIALMAVESPSYAQSNGGAARDAAHKQRLYYRLIDLGTLGGPDSAETVEFPYINNTGAVVGFADTSQPDPHAPNCFVPQCVTSHGFLWEHGVLHDLRPLPGGANSFAIWSTFATNLRNECSEDKWEQVTRLLSGAGPRQRIRKQIFSRRQL